MALSKSITSLITDNEERISRDFLSYSPVRWAEEHMRRRYSATPPESTDPPDHPAVLCYQHLLAEHTAVKGWFDDEGRLSPLLMSKHLARAYSGSISNGVGWDFYPNGEPNAHMLQFKGTLISCRRALELRAVKGSKLDCGSLEIGGIAKLVRSAYAARAEIHTWQPQVEGRGENKRTVTGAELARRWVSFRSFCFLLSGGAEPEWAWGVSKAQDVFGRIDMPAGTLI